MPKSKSTYILLFRGFGGATQLLVAPLRKALPIASIRAFHGNPASHNTKPSV